MGVKMAGRIARAENDMSSYIGKIICLISTAPTL